MRPEEIRRNIVFCEQGVEPETEPLLVYCIHCNECFAFDCEREGDDLLVERKSRSHLLNCQAYLTAEAV